MIFKVSLLLMTKTWPWHLDLDVEMKATLKCMDTYYLLIGTSIIFSHQGF
jgi:hypothetical protein